MMRRLNAGCTFDTLGLVLLLAGATPGSLGAQSPVVLGPAEPVPPQVVSRDGEGRVVLRAVRLTAPITVDGRLDEDVYSTTLAVSDFIQQEPREGEPATEKTEAWVFFDDKNLYVSARCWDSHPERMVISEMRRDHVNIFNNENFGFSVDTFHDRRNGFAFQTNPIGGLRDQLSTDEGNPNTDWNTVWYSKGARFEHGWTVEIVVPFKSLRYPGPGRQIWSINLRRIVRWKNEVSFLSRVPATFGNMGIYKFSSAATLVGLETPARTMNLELKPYILSSDTTDLTAKVPRNNDFNGDVGFDLKYGITQGLIADFTYNTDFAQVEVDEQQVNLTRFSQFFPEKREFFLEGQGIFVFGTGRRNFGGGTSNTPVLFFSRRIGLNKGVTIPIVAGARVTGRTGRYSIGAIDIHSEEEESTATLPTRFSVVRLKRDILRRSMVGVIATRRSPAAANGSENMVLGLDTVLSFYQNIDFAAYYARSRTPDVRGEDESYRAQFEYGGDRYGVQVEHLMVGDNFNPEVGFLRREDFRRSFGQMRFSPRPKKSRVRKYWYEVSYDYTTDARATTVETRELTGHFQTDFNNGDQFSAEYSRNYEFLPNEFEIAKNVKIPVGGYDFQNVTTTYALGLQHKLSGRVTVGRGSFYDGDKTETAFTGHVDMSARLSVEPGLSWNWVDLPQGAFTTKLVTTRVNFTVSPRTVLSALTQYNSSNAAVNTNIRFRWEYQPGSDLFVVFSEGRSTRLSGFPVMENRGFAVKFTRMFRM